LFELTLLLYYSINNQRFIIAQGYNKEDLKKPSKSKTGISDFIFN